MLPPRTLHVDGEEAKAILTRTVPGVSGNKRTTSAARTYRHDDSAIVAALVKTDIRFFLLQNDFEPVVAAANSAQLQAGDAPSKNAKVVPHDRSQFTLASAC
jgi:hypothetical protein